MGYDAGHTSLHQERLFSSASLRGIGARATFFDRPILGGNSMLSFDSYREVLSEHVRGHHVVGSAWFVVAAIIVFLVAFA
jgi:hypothetical protein